MTRADQYRGLNVSLQSGPLTYEELGLEVREDEWLLTFSCTSFEARMHTGSEVTAEINTGKGELEPTRYGYRYSGRTPTHGITGVVIHGGWSEIELVDVSDQPGPVAFWRDDEKVATEKGPEADYTYYMTAWDNPMVKAGVGVVGIGVATGIVGRWLGWW